MRKVSAHMAAHSEPADTPCGMASLVSRQCSRQSLLPRSNPVQTAPSLSSPPITTSLATGYSAPGRRFENRLETSTAVQLHQLRGPQSMDFTLPASNVLPPPRPPERSDSLAGRSSRLKGGVGRPSSCTNNSAESLRSCLLAVLYSYACPDWPMILLQSTGRRVYDLGGPPTLAQAHAGWLTGQS